MIKKAMMNKCKGCPYSNSSKCNGCGEHWSECYEEKKHKDLMALLDEIDKEKKINL